MGKVKEFVKKNWHVIGIGVGSVIVGGAIGAKIMKSKFGSDYDDLIVSLCELDEELPASMLEMIGPAGKVWSGVALKEMSVYEGLRAIVDRQLIQDDKNITGMVIFSK